MTSGASTRFTVVIPTRERADTLKYTLKTVIEQDYEDLEIVVSDNCSADETAALMATITDPRVKYVRTASRLSMVRNWEFALGHATGDFVMVLGDDDGLLPGSIGEISDRVNDLNPPALIWKKPDYSWPSSSAANLLSMDLDESVYWMNGKMTLSLLQRGYSSYGRLPVIYSGFVRREYLENLRTRTGSFFGSATPDVYSGIALLSEFPTYIFSHRSYSVNGGSRHSNGQASVTPSSSRARLFFDELDLPTHAAMPIIPGSITSSVAEALFQANDHCFAGGLRINRSRIISRILDELGALDEEGHRSGLEALQELDLSRKEQALVARARARRAQTTLPGRNDLSPPKNRLVVRDARKLGVSNVYDACRLVSDIQSASGPLGQPQRFSWSQMLREKIARRLQP